MNAVIGIVSGFFISLGMFAGGAGLAVYLLAVEPVSAPGPQSETTTPWPLEPRVVKRASHTPDVDPSLLVADDARGADGTVEEADSSVDMIATSAVAKDATDAGPRDSVLANAAHVAWCSDRYRSYRPSDNTYRSYRGRQRPCVSPYSETVGQEGAYAVIAAESGLELGEDPGVAEFVSVGSSDHPAFDHASSCFTRYRSYRAEDNTYQPYGGGPRRQCQ